MTECPTCPAIPRWSREGTVWEAVLLDLDHHGHPIPHRHCGCQDTGRVRMVEDRHHPDFGKSFPCPVCIRRTA